MWPELNILVVLIAENFDLIAYSIDQPHYGRGAFMELSISYVPLPLFSTTAHYCRTVSTAAACGWLCKFPTQQTQHPRQNDALKFGKPVF